MCAKVMIPKTLALTLMLFAGWARAEATLQPIVVPPHLRPMAKNGWVQMQRGLLAFGRAYALERVCKTVAGTVKCSEKAPTLATDALGQALTSADAPEAWRTMPKEARQRLDSTFRTIQRGRARVMEARGALLKDIDAVRNKCVGDGGSDEACAAALKRGENDILGLQTLFRDLNKTISDAMSQLGDLGPAAAFAGCLAAGYAAPLCMVAAQLLKQILPPLGTETDKGAIGSMQVPAAVMTAAASNSKMIDLGGPVGVDLPASPQQQLAAAPQTPLDPRRLAGWCVTNGIVPSGSSYNDIGGCGALLNDWGCTAKDYSHVRSCLEQRMQAAGNK